VTAFLYRICADPKKALTALIILLPILVAAITVIILIMGGVQNIADAFSGAKQGSVEIVEILKGIARLALGGGIITGIGLVFRRIRRKSRDRNQRKTPQRE
jgi:hypothetical protein